MCVEGGVGHFVWVCQRGCRTFCVGMSKGCRTFCVGMSKGV